MLERELDVFFQKRGYQRLRINVQELHVYGHLEDGRCHVVIYYPEHMAKQLTLEAQTNIMRQVRQHFYEAGQMRLDLLNLVETRNPAGMRAAFGTYDNVWFLDAQRASVILYEGQEDFWGLRRPLEDLLYGQAGSGNVLGQGSGRKSMAVSPCNTVLVIVNIAIFLLCEVFASTKDQYFLMTHGALSVAETFEQHEYYRFFTYMFLHSGIDHLFNNMLILWFLGDNLEKQMGHVKYLILYFASGILAGFASMSYNSIIGRDILCVGASGAIFGVAGALALVVLVNRGRVENLTMRQMVLFIALSLYGGFTSQGVDNIAHVGGLLAGVLLGALLYRRKAARGMSVAEKRLG